MGWSKGYAEWDDGDAINISVAFTWLLGEAREQAIRWGNLGRRVKIGGPALFLPQMRRVVEGVAEVGGDYLDAIGRHNPQATIASRGCPVGCWFCVVPKMEGEAFTLLPEFPVRPILCDNNLSALPADYQDYVVERYLGDKVPLTDANSGFEPRTFDGAVFERWRKINRGPWRFAYDDHEEREDVRRVMKMLGDVSPKLTRVYVLIGNEPFGDCMARIREVIEWGGEPHVQPFIKLVALEKEPHARHDWTVERLKKVARWANRRIWKYAEFSDYDSSIRTGRDPGYSSQTGLFGEGVSP